MNLIINAPARAKICETLLIKQNKQTYMVFKKQVHITIIKEAILFIQKGTLVIGSLFFWAYDPFCVTKRNSRMFFWNQFFFNMTKRR
jgi:hypothetical protein